MHKRKLQFIEITALNFVFLYPSKLRGVQELLLRRAGKIQTNKQDHRLPRWELPFLSSPSFCENLLAPEKRKSLSSAALFTQECDQEINALSGRERYPIVTRSWTLNLSFALKPCSCLFLFCVSVQKHIALSKALLPNFSLMWAFLFWALVHWLLQDVYTVCNVHQRMRETENTKALSCNIPSCK